MNVEANRRGEFGCSEPGVPGGQVRWLRWALAIATMIVMLSGCARIVAERVGPGDTTTKGIRYWLSEPYLLVKKPITVYRRQNLYRMVGTDLLQICDKKCGSYGQEDLDRFHCNLFGDGIDKTPVTNTTVKTNPATGSNAGTAASTTRAMEVVWLPDYCHQYALRQSTVMASQKVTVTLADGWKLASADADQDSTALAGKLVDLATVMVTPVAPEQAPAEVSVDTMELMGGVPGRVMIRISEEVLLPGLYKLVQREECTDLGRITDEFFRYQTSVTWTELPPRKQPPG